MSGPFKMNGFPAHAGVSPMKQDEKEFKGKSSDVMSTEGKYKGQMVDPRTSMPKGTSVEPSEQEIANKEEIQLLREKMKTAEPFSDEQEAVRQQILKLRGK
tara:strand:+ start:928 stop:1230 length:303 start_codon:yes stop_codon:yes gene_type:complete